MELSIQERLKDLRVERGLTLEQLEEQVNLSKSALGSYEAKDFKDISHYAIIKLAKFYGVTADYLLGLSQTRIHPNADLADLRLSDDMIDDISSPVTDGWSTYEIVLKESVDKLTLLRSITKVVFPEDEDYFVRQIGKNFQCEKDFGFQISLNF